MMKKKKTKPNQNKKVSYAKLDTLCQLLFKRIKLTRGALKTYQKQRLNGQRVKKNGLKWSRRTEGL